MQRAFLCASEDDRQGSTNHHGCPGERQIRPRRFPVGCSTSGTQGCGPNRQSRGVCGVDSLCELAALGNRPGQPHDHLAERPLGGRGARSSPTPSPDRKCTICRVYTLNLLVNMAHINLNKFHQSAAYGNPGGTHPQPAFQHVCLCGRRQTRAACQALGPRGSWTPAPPTRLAQMSEMATVVP